MLSPAESLGLAGAALDGRLKQAVHDVSDATLGRVAERLRADAVANDVSTSMRACREAVRIMLRPLLADAASSSAYVHHVCLQLDRGAEAAARALSRRSRKSAASSRSPTARSSWLRDIWTPAAPAPQPGLWPARRGVRLRAARAGRTRCSSWSRTCRASAASTMRRSPRSWSCATSCRRCSRTTRSCASSCRRDQRDLFLQLLIDHARAIGRDSVQPLLRRAQIRRSTAPTSSRSLSALPGRASRPDHRACRSARAARRRRRGLSTGTCRSTSPIATTRCAT